MQDGRVAVSTKRWLAPDVVNAFPIPGPTETVVEAHARHGTLLHSTDSRNIQRIRETNPTMGGIGYNEVSKPASPFQNLYPQGVYIS